MKLLQAIEMTKEAVTFLKVFKCLAMIADIWLYSLITLQDRTRTVINLILKVSDSEI
jgi:hypothetical protein